MATLQKSFKYEGDASLSPLSNINLNFEFPTFEFVTALLNGKPFIKRNQLGKNALLLTKKLVESSYEATFRNEYLIGSSEVSILNFSNYQGQYGFANTDLGILDSLTAEIEVATTDDLGNDIGRFSMPVIYGLSTISQKQEEITVRRATFNAAVAINEDNAEKHRLELIDYARKNIFLANKEVFKELLNQFSVLEPQLNDYAFLSIIGHVTDVSSGEPKIKIDAEEIKKFLKTHFNIDKAQSVKAILRLMKESLYDFPIVVPEIRALEISGTFKIINDGSSVSVNDFNFYDLSVEYTIQINGTQISAKSLTFDWSTIQPSQITDNQVSFSFAPGISNLINSPISIRVSGFDGSEVWQRVYAVSNPELQNLKIEVELIKPVVLTPDNGPKAGSANKKLTGKIVEMSGDCKIKDVTVVIQAKNEDNTLWKIIGSATTDASGNFSLPYPYGSYVAAQALVSLTPDSPADIPVYTDFAHTSINETIADDFLYLLVKDADCKSESKEKDCECNDGKESNRLPNQEELIKSDSYMQDIGGSCVNLSTPNRTLNEYSMTAAVRTSDPAMAKYILTKDTNGNFRLEGGLTKIDRKPVDLSNPIYWQDAPDDHNNLSIYQAVKVATGHILHYSVVTKADGYSLGELLYSLPLAPGQKKQIVIFDQTHTLQGSETQRVSQEESLASSLLNDVSIADTIAGTISETISGRSSATTSGVSGGYGLGAIIDAVGISLGVAGGVANANSSASQNSSRTIAAHFNERMRNSITQNAQSYREMNATVITTVQEGQQYAVTAEVIANHNHCHSLTMMYFEVLRHYAIYQELSYVEECIFIPLLMTDFTRENVYKWRDILAKHLLPMPSETYLQPFTFIKAGRRHPLLRGFDAIERIKSEPPYANVDFPEGPYDDEVINFITGEMYIRTNLPRPKTRYDRIKTFPIVGKEVDRGGFLGMIADGLFGKDTENNRQPNIDDYITVDANFKSVQPKDCIRVINFGDKFFDGGGIDKSQWDEYRAILAVAFPERPFRNTPEFLDYYFRDRLISEWDSIFYNDIAPLLFETIANNIHIGAFSLDFSTTGKYKGGEPVMRLNFSGRAHNKKRKEIENFKIEYDGPGSLNSGLVTLLVQNLNMRYSTNHYNGSLFSGFIGDDLIDSSPIYAPENANEKRNPRKEDEYIAAKLIEHLNSNLEHYNKCLWRELDVDRRYMLLDGFNIETYNDFGVSVGFRSLASVVKNELAGIAGNSLIMPVAPGYKIDLSYIVEQPEEGQAVEIDLLEHYKPLTPIPPYRVSFKNNGVFADAVQGACDACEKVKDNTSQDWDKFKTDEPTAINAVTVPVPEVTDWKAAFKDFATPIVNIQNAPAAPAPGSGLAAAGIMDLLGKNNVFKDITGLDQNQKNAMQTYLSNQENAKAFAEMAKVLSMQGHNTEHSDKIADSIRNSGLPQDVQNRLMESHLDQEIDGGTSKKAEQEASENNKPSLKDAAVKAVDEGKSVKASSNDGSGKSETIEIGESKPSPYENILAEVLGYFSNLKQQPPKENDCWAVAATIMMSWKRAKEMTVQEVLAEAGEPFLLKYTEGDSALRTDEKITFLEALNMVAESPASYPLQEYIAMLNAYGPLWITTDAANEEGAFSPHARILFKITGSDLTNESDIKFYFKDPAPNSGKEQVETYEDFLKKYDQIVTDDATGSLILQIVHFKDIIVGEGSSSPIIQRKAPNSVTRTSNIAKDALAKLANFKSISSTGAWVLDRFDVYTRLEELVKDPWLLNQAFIGYCGPAAFFMIWIEAEPEAFVDFAIRLYESGESFIGERKVMPNSTLLQTDITAINSHCPVGYSNILIADWMIMSSLQNTTVNTTTGAIDGGEVSGTWSSDIMNFLSSNNLYTNIHTEDEWGASDKNTVNEKIKRDGDKSELILWVDADIVQKHNLGYFPGTNHFVVLTSNFYTVSGSDLDYFDCWCWGRNNPGLGVSWYEFVMHVGPFIYATKKDAYWYLLPGLASEISIGKNDEMYALGTADVTGGHPIFKWDGLVWVTFGGSGIKIAVTNSGNPIVVNTNGDVIEWDGTQWKTFPKPVTTNPTDPGKAINVICGLDNSKYSVWKNQTVTPQVTRTFKWDGTAWQEITDWPVQDVPGSMFNIDPTGTIWYLDLAGNVWRKKSSTGSWEDVGGEGKEISIGADGSVWIVSFTEASGGYGIHKWNGTKWVKTKEGGGKKVAVNSKGSPFIVNSSGKIYQRKPIFPQTSL